MSQSITLTQIQQIAKAQKATLVEYSIIRDDFIIQGKPQTKETQLLIWVVEPTGEIAFRKVDLKPLWQEQNTSLTDLVTNSRQAIPSRSRAKLQQLDRLLIQTVADILSKDPIERVIFIPGRSLFLVPFPALFDTSGKYLIEKHTILTSPSIQVLDLTRQKREKVKKVGLKNLLVVGNPTTTSVPLAIGLQPKPLPSLPGAEAEAKKAASLFNTKAIAGNQATKSVVRQKLPTARIIHFATYGLADDVQGLDSWLALAPSGKDNGLLTAKEIINLQLNAELVVMSACESGRRN